MLTAVNFFFAVLTFFGVEMTETRTCTACAGTKHPVKMKGSTPVRDYGTNCSTCGGKGYIYVNESGSRGGGSEGGGSGRGGPCFIATTVFETDYCSELTTLRRFRDEQLLNNRVGRIFVKIYYHIGPYFARKVANRPLIKAFVRRLLERVCARIEKTW